MSSQTRIASSFASSHFSVMSTRAEVIQTLPPRSFETIPSPIPVFEKKKEQIQIILQNFLKEPPERTKAHAMYSKRILDKWLAPYSLYERRYPLFGGRKIEYKLSSEETLFSKNLLQEYLKQNNVPFLMPPGMFFLCHPLNSKITEPDMIFPDNEIVQLYPFVHSEERDGLQMDFVEIESFIKKRREGHSIFQQERCGEGQMAVFSMLAFDFDPTIPIKTAMNHRLYNQGIETLFISMKLFPQTSVVVRPQDLIPLIEKDGPVAIHVVVPSIHDFWLVVDDLSPNGVIIRDPFHGWCIKVTTEAFENMWRIGGEEITKVFQIVKYVPKKVVKAVEVKPPEQKKVGRACVIL
ncbi:MAG: hypothetical protein WCP39_02160 [Chlamydiota bacterium]